MMRENFLKALSRWLLALALLGVTLPQAWAHGYQIRGGDTLNIEVLEDPELNRSVLVLPDGSISFPLAGTVRARGRTVTDVQRTLTARLASKFAAVPNVFVSVGNVAVQPKREPVTVTIDVYATGEIANPGKLEVKPGTTILQLLAQAGGLTQFAADKRIELRRANRRTGHVTTYLFSYTKPVKRARISGATVLKNGDVIVVPQRRLFE